MIDPSPPAERSRAITEVTRRRILDELALSSMAWWGRLDEVAFLNRIFDLKSLPSTDHRYSNAEGDIRQHRLNNNDWDDDWIFHDARLALDRGADEVLLRFLAGTLHPVVRPADEVEALLQQFNDALTSGWLRVGRHRDDQRSARVRRSGTGGLSRVQAGVETRRACAAD